MAKETRTLFGLGDIKAVRLTCGTCGISQSEPLLTSRGDMFTRRVE
jgi:hypothetical protein